MVGPDAHEEVTVQLAVGLRVGAAQHQREVAVDSDVQVALDAPGVGRGARVDRRHPIVPVQHLAVGIDDDQIGRDEAAVGRGIPRVDRFAAGALGVDDLRWFDASGTGEGQSQGRDDGELAHRLLHRPRWIHDV